MLRRSRRERLGLAAVVLLLAALLAWARWDERQQIDAAERARLDQQAATVEHNLARQLDGVDRALRGVRTDIAVGPGAPRFTYANRRLQALCDAMPGVRNMHLLDAQGRMLASSVPQYVGGDFSERSFFRHMRGQSDANKLYVSPPFRSLLGDYTLNMMVLVPGPDGQFNGVVIATLDPDYFDTVLSSALYAPDMWGSVAHATGQVLLYSPADPRALGVNLVQPGSLFLRHQQGGRHASVLVGAMPSGAVRMAAQRTLQPPQLAMDQPLVLAVTRDVDAVFAPWRRQTRLDAAVFVLAALGAVWMLLALQRRRAQLEDLGRATQAQQAADAERVALALRGGDLALWDAHLPSGQGVVNDRWYTMLGYTPKQVNADASAWEALLHPDDRAAVLAAQQAHLDGHTEAYEASYRLRHGDGHWVWVLDRGCVVERAADGTPLRMVGTHMDISRRMQAEEALRSNEESLAITLHSIGDGVIATDPQGRVTRINAMAERLTGWPAEQALGQPLHALFCIFSASTRQPAQDPVARVLAQRDCGDGDGADADADADAGARAAVEPSNDTVLVARDGSEHQIAHSAAPIRAADGDVVGVVLVFSDVTAHYRTLQALRESEAQLATMAAALPGPVARLDRQGRHVFSNAACERWWGRDGAGAPGRHWRDMFGPQSQPLLGPELQAALAGETRTLDAVLATPGGQRDAMLTLVPDRDEAGAVRGCFVVINDITERKRAQEEVLRSAASLRMASRVARLGGWQRDVLAGTSSASAELLAMFEADPGTQVTPGSPLQYVAPGQRRLLRHKLQACAEHGMSFDLQVEATTALGHALHVRVLGEAVRDAGGRIVAMQGAVQDLTDSHRAQQQMRQLEQERQALQAQLRDAQKMESIGTLAGGIAHDFNNILPAILGNVALASADLPAGHAALQSLEQINKAGLRARSLVQQILTFSRRQPTLLQPQPLRPVVEETLALLRSTLPAQVRLDTQLAEQTLVVQADATQLQQVLMNLCTNAWHALQGTPARSADRAQDPGPARGRIEVGLQPLAADEATRQAAARGLGGLPPGPCVHLWVADNGSGMEPALLARIFDPFFTTKPVGHGTGLGLSVAHGIVRSHRGAIAVDSAPGQGSTFHVYLPLQGMPDAARSAGLAQVPSALGSGQQLLYVDDDDVMVVLVQRLLQRAGYGVTACGDAPSALALVQAQPQRFDLVVTDYNMPEMSGLELAQALVTAAPALPVIISSGYLTDPLREQAKALGVKALLRKENTLERLPGLVHEVLAGRR